MFYFCLEIKKKYQNSVVELHSCGIFKEILEGGRERQQVIRYPSFSHLREGVIYQPSIQASNKSTCVKAYIGYIFIDLNSLQHYILHIYFKGFLLYFGNDFGYAL